MLNLSVEAQEAVTLHRSYQEAAYTHKCPHTRRLGPPSLVALCAWTAVDTGELTAELLQQLPTGVGHILEKAIRTPRESTTRHALCHPAQASERPASAHRVAAAPTPQAARGSVQDSCDALRRSWTQRSRNLPSCIGRYEEALHATFYGRELSQPSVPAPTTPGEASSRLCLPYGAAAGSYQADEDARRVRLGVQRCFSSPAGRAMALFSPADVLALIDIHNVMLYGAHVTRALPHAQRVLGRQLAENVALLSAEFQRALLGEFTGSAPRPEGAGAAPEGMPSLQALQRIVPLAPVTRLEIQGTLERAAAWADEPSAAATGGRPQPRELRLGGGDWL